jgi:hypothetical protein
LTPQATTVRRFPAQRRSNAHSRQRLLPRDYLLVAPLHPKLTAKVGMFGAPL